ncbi:MAG: DUF5011 domain-containing protein, partial [bacterium]|nr:DUF5011 domain-containing protein [bacterium]
MAGRRCCRSAARLTPLQALTEGLEPALAAPRDLPASDNALTRIAALRIDALTGPLLPQVLDEHLWNTLLADNLSVGQLLDPEAPQLTLAVTPDGVAPGEAVTVTANATDNSGDITLLVTVDGVPLTLDNGTAVFTPDGAGVYQIGASATDAAGNPTYAEAELRVIDPTDTTAPTVAVHLDENAEITAPTDVLISAQDPGLTRWVAVLRPADASDPNSQITLAGGTSSVEQHPVKLDPSLLMNGFYQFIVEAEDAGGLKNTAFQTYLVAGNMKVGNFSFTVLDLEIPMMGMPIRVTRTYDTRRKDENLDFGQGWSIDYQNTKVEETRVPGKYWEMITYGGGFNQKTCLEPMGSPQVAVTLPSGKVERFDVVLKPSCGGLGQPGPINPAMSFEPADGTVSTLRAAQGHAAILYDGVNLMDGSEVIDPDDYILTTLEGYEFYLKQGVGLKQVKDPNGHTLTYSSNGIIHSAGKSL